MSLAPQIILCLLLTAAVVATSFVAGYLTFARRIGSEAVAIPRGGHACIYYVTYSLDIPLALYNRLRPADRVHRFIPLEKFL